MTESDDPAVIETVVVSATDLVTALEAGYRTAEDDTVLRVTPPFSGRMRARLHVEHGPDVDEPAPVCLDASSLVADTCPEPPEPDDIEDELRADPVRTYSVERQRERYRAALRQWRSSVPDHVVEKAVLPATGMEITISILGTVGEE